MVENEIQSKVAEACKTSTKEADLSCNCKGCKYISLESVDEPCCNCIDSDKYEKEGQTRPFKDFRGKVNEYR